MTEQNEFQTPEGYIEEVINRSIKRPYELEDIEILFILNKQFDLESRIPEEDISEGWLKAHIENEIEGFMGMKIKAVKKALKKALLSIEALLIKEGKIYWDGTPKSPYSVRRGFEVIASKGSNDLCYYIAQLILLYKDNDLWAYDSYPDWYKYKCNEVNTELTAIQAEEVESRLAREEAELIAVRNVSDVIRQSESDNVVSIETGKKLQKEEESKNKDIEGKQTPNTFTPSPKGATMSDQSKGTEGTNNNPNNNGDNMDKDKKPDTQTPTYTQAELDKAVASATSDMNSSLAELEARLDTLLNNNPHNQLVTAAQQIKKAVEDARTITTSFEEKLEAEQKKTTDAQKKLDELQKKLDEAGAEEPSWYHYTNKRSQAFVAGVAVTGAVVAGVHYYNKSKTSAEVSVDDSSDNVIQFDSPDYAQG